MKKIALVSITLNAVNPMTEYLSKMPGVTVRNYLDSCLTERIKAEGKISDESMERMFRMLAQACIDGADGIILTCTVFSPYVEVFRKLLSVPVIGADTAMLEQAAKHGGSAAVLYTFPGTLKTTETQLRNMYCKYGNEGELEMVWLKEAYEAAGKQDMKTHYKLIREQVSALDGKYDSIVLAQISMADAVKDFEGKHSEIFTSPKAAFEQLMEIIK